MSNKKIIIGLLDQEEKGVAPLHFSYQFQLVENEKDLKSRLENGEFNLVGISLLERRGKRIELISKLLETFPGLKIFARIDSNTMEKIKDDERLSRLPLVFHNSRWSNFKNSELVFDTSQRILHSIKDGTQLIEIPFGQLRWGGIVPFSLYVKINEYNYIPLKKMGEEVDKEFIDHYKKKGLDRLYIHHEDRYHLVNEINYFSQKLLEGMSDEDKLTLYKKSSRELMEEIEVWGVNQEKVNRALDTCKSIEKHLTSNKNIIKILGDLVRGDRDFYSDSYLTAILTALIYGEIKNLSLNEIQGAVLGAFLQRIGLISLPENIKSKKMVDLSKDEWKIYKNFPLISAKMLSDAGVSNWVTLSAVEQAQERYDGSGFPMAIRGEQISRPARVIYLANKYSAFLQENDLTPFEGLNRFYELEAKDICPKTWGSFTALFNGDKST